MESIYNIHEDNFPKLKTKLSRISKACSNYGIPVSIEVLGETLINGLKFIQIQVQGSAEIEGYTFVAKIEHGDGLNAVKGYSTEFTVPDHYYTTRALCEHCNTDRTRINTYLIHNESTGEFKQIGKTCLKLYTGGLSAEHVASWMDLQDALEEGTIPGPGYKTYHNILDVLATASEFVKHFGFSKADSENPTKNQVHRYLNMDYETLMEAKERGINPSSESAQLIAREVLKWIEEQEMQFGYISNLKVAAGKGYADPKDYGLLVSAISGYNRYLDKMNQVSKAMEDNTSTSTHQGAVGSKITVSGDLKLVTGYSTDWGWKGVYKLTEASGNIFVWKTSKHLDEGQVTLTGTVKKHNEYKGIQETELTRCKIS